MLNFIRVRFTEVLLIDTRVMMFNYFSNLTSLIQVDDKQLLLIVILFIHVLNFSLSFSSIDFTPIGRLEIIINKATPLSHLIYIETVPLMDTIIITGLSNRLNVLHGMLGIISDKTRDLLIICHQLGVY